jgi:hypothetical protein
MADTLAADDRSFLLELALLRRQKWIRLFRSYWHYGDTKRNGYSELAPVSFVCGVFAIVWVEKNIHINEISFPGTQITDSGQLIPLIIGIFTLSSAVVRLCIEAIREY